jgi:prefoldin alpha subunit
MADEREFQEKVLAYRIIESRIEGLLRQREALATKIMEIQTTLNGINELGKTDEDALFSLGSETHFFGKIVDKKRMIVEIGANIAIEKTFEESKEILKKRMGEIENFIVNLEKNIMQLSSSLQELESQINEIVQKRKEAG